MHKFWIIIQVINTVTDNDMMTYLCKYKVDSLQYNR